MKAKLSQITFYLALALVVLMAIGAVVAIWYSFIVGAKVFITALVGSTLSIIVSIFTS